MTVQDLRDILDKVEDKTMEIGIADWNEDIFNPLILEEEDIEQCYGCMTGVPPGHVDDVYSYLRLGSWIHRTK